MQISEKKNSSSKSFKNRVSSSSGERMSARNVGRMRESFVAKSAMFFSSSLAYISRKDRVTAWIDLDLSLYTNQNHLFRAGQFWQMVSARTFL